MKKSKSNQDVLRELREFRGLSYRELAKEISKSHSWVQQLETGKIPFDDKFKSMLLEGLQLGEPDWELAQGSVHDLDKLRLEFLGRVHALNPEKLLRGLLFVRNLLIVFVLVGQ